MLTLDQIAKLVGGEVVGDPDTEITGVETIEGTRQGDLTFAVNHKQVLGRSISGSRTGSFPKRAAVVRGEADYHTALTGNFRREDDDSIFHE